MVYFSNKVNEFIAVHVDAGYYLPKDRKALFDICKSPYENVRQNLLSGKNATDACVAATVILVGSPSTNAGMGSNLNISKRVEYDAGIMNESGFLYTGIGAVPHVKNPILIPFEMIKRQIFNSYSKVVHSLFICGL